jgi:serine/threonine-protein kinase
MGVNEFLDQLKQRKLVQWALTYVAAAFALIQVFDIVAQRFGWPEASVRFIITALAVGFFVVLVLAWYHGERGAQRVTGTELLILALTLAIGGGLLWRVAGTHGPAATAAADGDSVPANASAAAALAVAITDKSIAVLPLVNTSGDPANEYFSDGLSEELISVLAKIPDLKIIGRSSSFHFKGTSDDSRTVGLKLGVAKLLEGSVRKQGERVRISVDLINAADSRQLWSQTYDRELKDIFAVQSEIATAVVEQLKLKFIGTGVQPQAMTQNLAAYNALLQGDFYRALFTLDAQRKAVTYYSEAIRLDPGFAVGYARLSRAWRTLAAVWLEASEVANGYVQARRAAEQALKLAPDLGEAHQALGWVLMTPDFDFAAAESEMRRAAVLAPQDAEALNGLAYVLAAKGQLAEADEIWRKAAQIEPLAVAYYLNGARVLIGLGRLDEAEALLRKSIELQPGASHVYSYLTTIDLLRGDGTAAQRDAGHEESGFWSDYAQTLARQGQNDAGAADASLRRFIEQHGDTGAFQIASIYALRKDPDRMFEWLDRAYSEHDSGLTQLLVEPFSVRYRSDPRFAALCAKLKIDVTRLMPNAAGVKDAPGK